MRGSPIIQVSLHRDEGLTKLYFSKHESIQGKELIWPKKIDVLVLGETISVEDTAQLGVNVLKETMAYYVVPSLPDKFTVTIGSVYLIGEKIAVEPIVFSHGSQRFLNACAVNKYITSKWCGTTVLSHLRPTLKR